jgi:hypothetical protein
MVASVGTGDNGAPNGFPIFLSGIINNPVAYGVLMSGNPFRVSTPPKRASYRTILSFDLAMVNGPGSGRR